MLAENLTKVLYPNDNIFDGKELRLRQTILFRLVFPAGHSAAVSVRRQALFLLYIMIRYSRLKNEPALDIPARTFLISAKAAPGYAMAKLIIKLVHQVAEVINRDPQVDGKMNVVFLPNYRVSLAEKIIPAADLSEQISLARKPPARAT